MKLSNNSGFLLLEVVLAISISILILMSMSTLLSGAIKSYRINTEVLSEKQDAQIVLKYIEKRLMECNHQTIKYHHLSNTFEAKDKSNKTIWVDLSGKLSTKQNTMVNFYKYKNEIRVNKNTENNVLSNNIEAVNIKEKAQGKLIEIEVVTRRTGYSERMVLQLDYERI